ncbi:MaoC family dehydratase [Streptomyces sp. NPDC090036]|uniref:MaoC family dehydratase n=1 Tax=Streptomyces sp. NPDC090036 TaxID=3365926 RepID=UPI00380E54DD
MTPEEYGVLESGTQITEADSERFDAVLASAGGSALHTGPVRAAARRCDEPPVGLLAALALQAGELLLARAVRRRGLVALHGVQKLRMLRRPRSGAALRSTAAVRSVKPLGAGTATEVVVSFADESGDAVAESTSLLVHSPPLSAPAAPPAPAPGRAAADVDPARVSTYRITRELVAGYAAVSGDRNPIHLSEEAARGAGFDDVIAHGMLTFALAGRHLAERVGADRIGELQLRFSRPLHVPAGGARLTVTDRTAANGALVLAATDAVGTPIATGRAALHPPRTDRGTHRA